MGRKTVLLIVAAVVAALGTSLVFLYVQGADARAASAYDNVEVLKAVEVIAPGETLRQAQQAGKLQMGTVPQGQLIAGAVTKTTGLEDKVALSTILPNEQIVTGKFGAPGDQRTLTIPDGKMAISVQLTDPARVAGFVQPGADVSIFMSDQPTEGTKGYTRLLLPRIEVIGVGQTTVVSTTTTDTEGEQTTEQLPRTLLTLAVSQEEAEKIIYASKNGEIAFALLTEKSKVKKSAGVSDSGLFR